MTVCSFQHRNVFALINCWSYAYCVNCCELIFAVALLYLENRFLVIIQHLRLLESYFPSSVIIPETWQVGV